MEREYNIEFWTKRNFEESLAQHHQVLEEGSTKARKLIPNELNIAYGTTSKEYLDIYGTDLPNESPVLIFIHGGAWQNLNKDISAHMAYNLWQNGIKTVVIGFDLCPNVELSVIIEEVVKAVKFCLKDGRFQKAKSFTIMGHSAGAHLAASIFMGQLSPEENSRIVQAVLIAGVFDVTPIIHFKMSKALNLDEEKAKKTSPMLNDVFCNTNMEFKVYVGGDESAEFKRQSREYHEKVRGKGLKSEFSVLDNHDHLSIIDELGKGDFVIIKNIVNLVKK